MIIVNISDVEDLVLAKYKIEQSLLDSHTISEKYSLGDFITKFLKFGENVYLITEDIVYPFSIQVINQEMYIFITENENSDNSKKFLNLFKECNFDFSSLDDVKIDELPNYKKENIFIINGTYKKLHK